MVCRLCVADGVPRRSLAVALIVGTILNLINQGEVLLGAASLNLIKLLLTYAVPYCVATYGAVSFQLALRRRVPSSHAPRLARESRAAGITSEMP
jgi:hypothetical protein